MLKKISWIAVLFVTLAILFTGCTDAGELDDGTGPEVPFNPIVEGAKYLEIGKRVNSWDSIDIRAGKAGVLDQYTADADHTITIYGKAIANLAGISLGQTDSDYSTNWGWGPAKADGTFTIEAKVPWSKLADSGNNKRINMPLAAAAYYVYEIVINDGENDIYKLSKDKEVQELDNGQILFPDDKTPTTWLVRAGSPVVKVIEPGSAGGLESIYKIPESATAGVTFVDLNNYGTRGTKKFAPNDLVEGELAETDLTLKFTKKGQRVHFKLTNAQIASYMEADTLDVTITATPTYTGTVPVSEELFYFALTDPSVASPEPSKPDTWFGTTPEEFSSASGTEYDTLVTASFDAEYKGPKTLAYFSIGLVQDFPVTLKVTSIEIKAVKKDFEGTLTINDDAIVGGTEVGTNLLAVYTGSEDVTYTWKRSGKTVGTGQQFFAPLDVAASYEVTISAYGYNSKTSAAFIKYNYSLAVKFGSVYSNATAGSVTVVPELAGSVGALGGIGNGSITPVPPTLTITGTDTGYKTTSGAIPSWGNVPYVIFSVNFPVNAITGGGATSAITNLSGFKTLQFDVQGSGADGNYKGIILHASNTKIADHQSNSITGTTTGIGSTDSGDTSGGFKTVTITFDKALTGTVWFAIHIAHGGSPNDTNFEVKNVKFLP